MTIGEFVIPHLINPSTEFDVELLRRRLNGVERWRAVLAEAYAHLCPHRWMNSNCGCISALSKQIMRQCASRLDAVLFNALVRGGDWEDGGKDVNDPILDPNSLPFSPGPLSFTKGIELKKAISTWSDVLMEIENTTESMCMNESMDVQQQLIKIPSVHGSHSYRKSRDSNELSHLADGITDLGSSDPSRIDSKPSGGSFRDQSYSGECNRDFFPMLKAMADLLMLPKELLVDPTVRKEACGALSPHLIRRIVFLFVPDENAPDYISPSLLAALNSEANLYSRKKVLQHSVSGLKKASLPEVNYIPPASDKVGMLINHFGLSLNTNMELTIEKGDMSDEEMNMNENPLALLQQDVRRKRENCGLSNGNSSSMRMLSRSRSRSFRKSMGYKLLRKVWEDHKQSLVFE